MNAHNAVYYEKGNDCAVVVGSPEQVGRCRDFWLQAGNVIQLIETTSLINFYNTEDLSAENAHYYKKGLREVSDFLIKCCQESELNEQRKALKKKEKQESVDSAQP